MSPVANPLNERVPRAAWLCYGVGIFAYIVAVFNRSSFGVAALPAVERFHASASDIASFTVVQLIVYAALQVPVGILIDRIGPRRLIIFGAIMMTLGQALLAIVTSVTPALLARVLIGAGDAFTFTCVLRLVADWFPARRVPLMTQFTGLLGQVGQVMSAIPFAALVAVQPWTVSFLSAAALGVIVVVVTVAALREPPKPPDHPAAMSIADTRKHLAIAWRHPGTRLGMWVHFTSQFTNTVFALLWGFPFLTAGMGLSIGVAGALMTLTSIIGVFVSPVLGHLVSRHPLRRSTLVFGIITTGIVAWSLVIFWPGRAPMWVLILLMFGVSIGGPGSMIGFDFARTFNPPIRLGTATGIVNVGGFVASLVTMALMGVVLDLATSDNGGGYTLSAFKYAFSVQYVIWAFGIVAMLRARHLTRRRLAVEDGVVVPPLRYAIRRDWERYRGRRSDHAEVKKPDRATETLHPPGASDGFNNSENDDDWQI